MAEIARALSEAVLGKAAQTELAVTCLASGGHLLIEDVPGVGKTTLAEAIARSCSLSYRRVQFTADLMPADILGTQVLQPARGTLEFRPGPIFTQLLLADELNRAPPRTQSSLLEAMAQGQVSLDGTTHALPQPFYVIATQNPADFTGTYPLPDSQLDRFAMRISLGHPGPEVESALLRTRGAMQLPAASAVAAGASPEDLLLLRRTAGEVTLGEEMADYLVRLINATRHHPEIERGASTRAALSVAGAARAHALWDGRDFVTPGDVQKIWGVTLSHRLLLRRAVQGSYSRDEAVHLLEEILRQVPAPR
jgi:MoxR-like ATPase